MDPYSYSFSKCEFVLSMTSDVTVSYNYFVDVMNHNYSQNFHSQMQLNSYPYHKLLREIPIDYITQYLILLRRERLDSPPSTVTEVGTLT